MQARDNGIILSATDLSTFLGCRHRSGLDLAVALGLLAKPPVYPDPLVDALRQRGAEHERAYVGSLRRDGLGVIEISAEGDRVGATLAHLRAGADVVVQAALEGDGFIGYADVLRRVDRPSPQLGAWSYEAYDTKLARETRGGAILQLSAYSDLLTQIQGTPPERFYVVSPDGCGGQIVHPFRVPEYVAYYRMIRRRLLTEVGLGPDALQQENYPDPVEHCDVCRWWERCEARRRGDDHLSYIAGISRAQRMELAAQGVTTLAAAATMPVPLPFRPARGTADTYVKIREQARVQLQARESKQPMFETLPVAEGSGLCRLPAPSAGDCFLDLEGARFARDGGREYLFGLGTAGSDGTFGYRAWWATSDEEERHAFEAVIDAIAVAVQRDPNLHVYHFNHYEPTALRKLVGRHATRADELDALLRAGRFVDVYPIARQAVRAGVESYSIKKLEPLYGFRRDVDLRAVSAHLQAVELALETGDAAHIDVDMRAAVEGYNRDDCHSALRLREWLEGLRRRLTEEGTSVPRPEPGTTPAPEAGERQRRADALRARMLNGVPVDARDSAHPLHARWLLAYLIDWHHREEKAAWWEYFRIRDLAEDDLLDEPKAIVGLEHVERVEIVRRKGGKPTGSVVDRYRYPQQDLELKKGDALKLQDDRAFGSIQVLDRGARLIEIRKGAKVTDVHPSAVFSARVIGTDGPQAAVMRFAERMLGSDFAEVCAGADLLLRRSPRLAGGIAFQSIPGESASDVAVRIVASLKGTTLAIQGPPGAGKTYTGARMILELLSKGKRVGVTAGSHKVIQNLLDEVARQAWELNTIVRCARKVPDDNDVPDWETAYCDNEEAVAAIRAGRCDVFGATAWFWSREDAVGCVDVLFVDEAGQVSLANVLAVAPAADGVVLLGDPQQLDQPQKGSHPDGVDVSALQHVIGQHQTMPKELGVFMGETWRLAPKLCEFTSEVFYEGKLHPKPGLEHQRLAGTDGLDGAGLWWVPIEHDGNRSVSTEEVEAVAALVGRLLTGSACWFDAYGVARPLTPADLRVVAPFNAQVNRLEERLAGRDIQVGTVDRFQGQTCAVVIYSMATSRPEDAPHGMEFLYSLNRLNVATSRARCAAFVVASLRLLEPECRTPRQMRLANAVCRYVELCLSTR